MNALRENVVSVKADASFIGVKRSGRNRKLHAKNIRRPKSNAAAVLGNDSILSEKYAPVQSVETEDPAVRMAVFNQKGGVGKTTTALNLAAALARDSAPTLLVDLDPQAHLSAVHGKALGEAHNSVFALYQDNRPLEDLAIVWEGVGRLIPAHAELIKVDSIFGKGPAILNRLNTGLQALETAGGESTAVIDCCPFLGVLSLNAIFASDRILVPVSSDYLSLRGALQIEHTLKALEPVLKTAYRTPLPADTVRPAPQDELRYPGPVAQAVRSRTCARR